MVAQQAAKRMIDLHFVLHYFGVPLDGPLQMFGDNKFVVTSGMTPHLTLGKHWNPLSHHPVCR